MNDDLRPGCFGGALTHQPDDSACKDCEFAAGCAPASAESLTRLRAALHITVETKTPARKASRTPAPERGDSAALVGELPLKVRQLVERIERKGVKVGDSLRAGINPFDTPVFLKVAAHLLLKLPGGFDRNTLRAALMHKFGWAEQTTASHVGQIFHLLPALGAAVEMNGRLLLKKD